MDITERDFHAQDPARTTIKELLVDIEATSLSTSLAVFR